MVLASGSPRRRELLTRAGIEHEVLAAPFDDAELLPGADDCPPRWAAALAFLKAQAAAARLPAEYDGPCVLAADTIVVHRGRMIGKPRDERDAEAMIRGLMGDGHEVVTGCAVLEPRSKFRKIFADTAKVRLGVLSEEQIAAHLRAGAWRGKAGGYNLDEQIAAGWPIGYEGDPATVMGLPMERLKPILKEIAARGASNQAGWEARPTGEPAGWEARPTRAEARPTGETK